MTDSPSVDKPQLVLATGNPGKVRELTNLLGEEFVIQPRPADLPETVEDGKTLLDNATKKAVEVFANTGLLAMADDTGLFVDALGGKPGVRSARFAGPGADDAANRTKLLADLGSAAGGAYDPAARRAYFETVVVIVGAPPPADATDADRSSNEPVQLVPLVGRGRVYGHIVAEPRGDGGFGYDSLFQPDEGDGRTFAEMELAHKQAISHRSRALAQARELLVARLDRNV